MIEWNLPAIKNKTVAGIFLPLTTEHTFCIIANIEHKFETLQQSIALAAR